MAKKDRFYKFSIVTYLDKNTVIEILQNHSKFIRTYAGIVHDKDDSPTHCHILIRTYNGHSISAVLKWFLGYYDDKEQLVNSFIEIINDLENSFLYLTHNTEQAIKDNKHLYSQDDIFSNDIDLWLDSKCIEVDSITLALADLLGGASLSDTALKYGRDFIIHYQSLKALINDIKGESLNE